MDLNSIRVGRDFLGGLLLGLPFAYPAVPLYWFGMASVFVMLRPGSKRVPQPIWIVLFLVLGLGTLSNIVAPRPELVGFVRSFLSVLTLGLFVYGMYVDDVEKFLRGYLLPTNILAIAVPVMFVASGIFTKGAMVFVVPSFRLWGAAYFPDWPNFIALSFCLAFILQLYLIKRPIWALINLLAALLTTSRLVFLALGILALFWVLRSQVRIVYAGLLTFAILVGTGPLSPVDERSVNLVERLTRTADREAIYGVAASLIEERPLLGFGSVLFDRQLAAPIVHESFHSFYLDILIRFGFPTLLLVLVLLVAFDWRIAAQSRVFLPVAALILAGSFLQNYLRHPHFFLFYSAWIFGLHQIARIERRDVQSNAGN